MISKELLSDVFKEKVINCEVKDNYVAWQYYFDEHLMDETINIHELAHKCKEKALEYGYVVVEYPNCVNVHKDGNKKAEVKFTDNLSAKYRAERVIKACQWALENK